MSSPVAFVWEPSEGVEERIRFDAMVAEVHETTATVTSHPVERGANVGDHVRAQPRRLQLEAFVSDEPIDVPESHMDGVTGSVQPLDFDGLGGAQVLQFSAPFRRTRAVYEELDGLSVNGVVLKIETPLRDYENVVLLRVSSPRTVRGGISFRIDVEQVRIAETDIVDLPTPRQTRGQREQNNGTTATEDASAQQRQRVSGLARADDSLGLTRGLGLRR